ncbi:Wzz/FepE/Etk N-terminal domain-containing protein [Cohnella sp. GCM10027633]|uniref:Wzz/FepE/Etk N-terminal domain-containing protein n=1 Tax=unclassified Cohnella TaxID=2636738 RepID=UPI003639C6CC
MNDEILIRDLIAAIWNGRKKISIFTVAIIVLTFALLYFTMTTKYETTSSIMSNHKNLQSFAQQIVMDKNIHDVVSHLKFDSSIYHRIKDNIKVTSKEESNMVSIMIKGIDPDRITKVNNMLAYRLARQIERVDLLDQIQEYKSVVSTLDTEIKKASSEVLELEERISNTPKTILLSKSLSDEQIIASSNNAMKLITEEINEEYIELKNLYNIAVAETSKLESEQRNYNELITQKQNKAEQLTNEQDWSDSNTVVNTDTTSIVITPAIVPTIPLATHILVKVAMAGLIAFIMSSIYFILKHYVKEGIVNGKTTNKSN